MKLAIVLAIRNLLGAGLRTWLNVVVLSFSFVIIIWMKGVMAGWDLQAKTDMRDWEIGAGQYWHAIYDPYDPFSLDQSHSPIPGVFSTAIENGEMEPLLIAQGSIYPQGRIQPVLIKGIDPHQTIFKLPTELLDTASGDAIPAIIGRQMALILNATKGESMILQWRNNEGMFDAASIIITGIFDTNVPAIDRGQIYIDFEKLNSMLGLNNEATLVTFNNGEIPRSNVEGWILKTQQELTAQIDEMLEMKSTGQNVFYIILLLLAMLAIFDTQVLSIFRRQKEIGTYIALGYTRKEVVGLFTVEGTMYAVFAALLSAAYGLPFLAWQAKAGWTMPVDVSQMGISIAQTLYPVYSTGLVISTIILVMVVTAIVSYWPSKRIAKMNPTEALRGKLQ